MPLIEFVFALIAAVAAAWLIHTYLPMPENFRPMIDIVLALIVVGMALWLIDTYIPMAGSIKAILNIVVVTATCVAVLKAFGLWNQVVRTFENLTRRATAVTDDPGRSTPSQPASNSPGRPGVLM